MTEDAELTIEELKEHPNILQYIMKHLSKKIKHDKATKIVTFLTGLSAYTKTPINLFIRGESSSGKTWNARHALQYYPPENIWDLGDLSPTALIHEHGTLIDRRNGEEINPDDKPATWQYKNENGQFDRAAFNDANKEWREKIKNSVYLVNLEFKTILFLDAPKIETLNKLKPILSHDKYEIEYRFTDRTSKSGLRTSHVIIRGFPATIFCSSNLEFSKDFTTRGFTVTPQEQPEKIGDVIDYKMDINAHPWLHENDKQLETIRKYIEAVQSRYIIMKQPYIVLPYAKTLGKHMSRTTPRDMRDADYFTFLIKMSCLLHLYQRPLLKMNGAYYFIANMDDFCNALEVWTEICETTKTGLPQNVLDIFYKLVLPLHEQGETIHINNLVDVSLEKLGKKMSSKTLYKHINLLREIGWVDTDPDPNDKRKNIVRVLGNPKNILLSSLFDFPSKFTAEKLKEWFIEVINYSPETPVLLTQVNEGSNYSLKKEDINVHTKLTNESIIVLLYEKQFSETNFIRRFGEQIEKERQKHTQILEREEKRIILEEKPDKIESLFPTCFVCHKPISKLDELDNLDGRECHILCKTKTLEGRKT